MSNQDQARIFVVDDTPSNIDVLMETLSSRYDISVALDGETALEDIPETNPDLILLDVMMPGLDGYTVCKRLKEDPNTAEIPVIFITAKQEVTDETTGFAVGAVDYITKPFSPAVVQSRVNTHLQLVKAKKELAEQNQILDRKVRERTQELVETRLQIIQRLGRAAEYKDNETGLHVIRMSHYSRILALAAGFSTDKAEIILQAAPMHDIGKIGIPDRILLKPGSLDNEEWSVMRKHPGIGAGIIGVHEAEVLKVAKIVALTHHEKWDGSGYPRGLKGEAIPIEGRIIAIADVFDALTTARPYKDAWSVEKTVEVMKQDSGTHFDPNLTPLFFDRLDSILEIKEKWSETSKEKTVEIR
ncbi:MAG: response regulator [Magnetococcales bacterium]|nr:response regulator [Magnetococcales bacterium]